MLIQGTFVRFIWRNEKTGDSKFTIKTGDNTTQICTGIVQHYPKYIPLQLNGYIYEENGYSIFKCESIKPHGYEYESICRFLYGKEFPDIGMITAKKIIDTTGLDIFSYIKSDYDINELAKKSEVSVNIMDNCIKRLKYYNVLEDIISLLRNNGGNYFNAMKLFEKYSIDSLEVIKHNPYVLLYADTPFTICEKIAFKQNMHACDKKRVHAIVENVMLQNKKNGNTWISFHDLCRQVKKTEENAECGYYTQTLFIGEEIMGEQYHIVNTENDLTIYLEEDYEAELQIVENLHRLITSAIPLSNNKISISEIEQSCGITYSEEQKNAFHIIDDTGVKIITGGPGTGKTSVTNGLLKKFELENPEKKILLCAPTGCAARRMQESTGRLAGTIHKTQGIRPYEKNILFPSSKLDADCVVIDESSMIDTYLMARLLASIKNGTLVIFLGDPNQLPSVGPGNVFSDIITSGIVKVYRLNTIFRQGNKSLIIDNSKKVINGECNLIAGNNFKIKRFNNEDDMILEASNIASQCYKREMYNFKLYTPSKNSKFKSGTINMNRTLQKTRFSEQKNSVYYGLYNYHEDDFVMFDNNNYEKGYYNGQEGVIQNIQEHGGTYHISIKTDENYIYLSGTELDDIELGYALTAHKSQGGESDNAIILIPQKPASLLKRQLLYVEITRAKKSVIILSEKDALEKAISSYMEVKRNTGLLSLLKKR